MDKFSNLGASSSRAAGSSESLSITPPRDQREAASGSSPPLDSPHALLSRRSPRDETSSQPRRSTQPRRRPVFDLHESPPESPRFEQQQFRPSLGSSSVTASGVIPEERPREPARRHSSIAPLRQTQARLTGQRDDLSAERAGLERSIAEHERRLGELRSTEQRAQTTISAATDSQNKVQQQLGEAKKRLEETRATAKARVAAQELKVGKAKQATEAAGTKYKTAKEAVDDSQSQLAAINIQRSRLSGEIDATEQLLLTLRSDLERLESRQPLQQNAVADAQMRLDQARQPQSRVASMLRRMDPRALMGRRHPAAARPRSPNTELREAETQHTLATTLLETTQASIRDVSSRIMSAEGTLERLQGRREELSGTLQAREQKLHKERENLGSTETALDRARAVEHAELRSLAQVKGTAAADINAAERDVKRLNADLKELNTQIRKTRSELHDAQFEIARLEPSRLTALERLNELNPQLAEVERQLTDVTQRIEQQERTRRARSEIFRRHPVLSRAHSFLSRTRSTDTLPTDTVRSSRPSGRRGESEPLISEGGSSRRVPGHPTDIRTQDAQTRGKQRATDAEPVPDPSSQGTTRVGDVPHSGKVDVSTKDKEAFALRNGTLYMKDSGTGTFAAQLEGVEQLKLGSNDHAYARSGDTLFALTEAPDRFGGIRALELPCPRGARVHDFTVSPDGSIAYIVQHPAAATGGPQRELCWLPRDQDSPTTIAVPPTLNGLAGLACDPVGQVYLLDQRGEMWRGNIENLLARTINGSANASGWRRLDIPNIADRMAEITTLPNGSIQASSRPRRDLAADAAGRGTDDRLHFVLSLKDEWLPQESMSANVLDLTYKERLKNASGERKNRVTLGLGAGKRSGFAHEQPPSLALRFAKQLRERFQHREEVPDIEEGPRHNEVDSNASQESRQKKGWSIGSMASAAGPVLGTAAAVAATHVIAPVGNAAWLARPVAALVPTLIRNRRAFHASPPPVQLPGFEAREAQSKGSRWLNFFNAAYGIQTERGARNAHLSRELATGLRLMQRHNAIIPPQAAPGTPDHYAVIRTDMVSRLTSNASVALDRIEKELGTIDGEGRAVASYQYRNNELYKRFQFNQPGALGKMANAPKRVDDSNNALHLLHVQAQALLQNSGSREAQALVERLHHLVHVKQIYIPVSERDGVKDITGMGRDTAHAFITTQLHKIASDLSNTFQAVKDVTAKLPDSSATPADAARTAEIIEGMCREAAVHMDAPGAGAVNTEFNRYTSLAEYAAHTDPGVVENQLKSEFLTLRALPEDNRLSRLDAPEFAELRQAYHGTTRLALQRLEEALGINGVYDAYRETGAIPQTSKGAPYRQLQQHDQALVWSDQNVLFELYKRRMMTLHGQTADQVRPPPSTLPDGARGDVPLESSITVHEPREEGELTARLEFLLRQGIHIPVEDPAAKPMEPNASRLPMLRGLTQTGPTPAGDKVPHTTPEEPQGTVAQVRNWFSNMRSTVVNSGMDVLLGQMVRCQLAAEEAAREVADRSARATSSNARPSPSTSTAPPAAAQQLAPADRTEIATRSKDRIAGGKDNPAGALFEKGVVASSVERVAEKLRIQQMIASHPDHIVTRAINMQGTIHPEDVEAFARMAWRALPTGATIRLDHTLHLGIDFDGLGFSFRFVNRQLQGAPEHEDPSKNVLNIPLNSLFSFQPTPYFGKTRGTTVSLTKTTDGADIKMSNFTDHEAKLLAGKLMWGAGRYGLHKAMTSDGKPSQDVLALIYWGFELLPNLLKISGRGTEELTFHLKNDNSGLAENAAVNFLDRKASVDHLLEVCASIVESDKNTKTREHEVGFHPLAASVMIANRPDDKNTRFKAVAAGLIQAALTGTYSSETERTQGGGQVKTTTTAKRKSTNIVLKPIEVTELQFSRQWPWNSPVPIKGTKPEVGDGVEMEHKLPTWIRVGIVNVFQHNGLACNVTMTPDGKVEGVNWGATTRHDFNEKSFPQLAELRQRAPTAYKNMITLATRAEEANTLINVNMELTPDALDRLNNCRNENESLSILKDVNSYRIKSVSAGEEYRYETGTFFGFDFFRMDRKAVHALSDPSRGSVTVLYPEKGDTRSAIDVKVRGEFTVGGGDANFQALDNRLNAPGVEDAILDVGTTPERVLLTMTSPDPANDQTLLAIRGELHDPDRATRGLDHFAMHNGQVVWRTRRDDGLWHQAALSTDQLNRLLATPPQGASTAGRSRPSSTLSSQPGREAPADRPEAATAHDDGSIGSSDESHDELRAMQTELQRSGAQSWAQKMLQAMSAGTSLTLRLDPQEVFGEADLRPLMRQAVPGTPPEPEPPVAGRPVYVGEIIRAMAEAREQGKTYTLDAAQRHVLATFFPGNDGSHDATLVDNLLRTDPHAFIRAADLVAGRVKPALYTRMDVPEVAALGTDLTPAPASSGVPALGGISAGGS